MAHQFWISYHPPTGAKHGSSGDETPPIPEEELEQQKIEHERQIQKEKNDQAKEAEEVAQLDIELLHQRAIEAEEEQKRESVIKKSTSAQLTKPQSSQSIANDGIFGYSDLRRGLIGHIDSCGATTPPPSTPSAGRAYWNHQICNKCPRIYLPVCGNDSKAYTNECKLNCLNYVYGKFPPVVVLRRGLCQGFPSK